MASIHSSNSSESSLHHKRTKSSVLRSFMHKRTHSNGANLPAAEVTGSYTSMPPFQFTEPALVLPNDCQYPRALAEVQQNRQSPKPESPKKPKEEKRPTTNHESKRFLHKKTLSSISLKSLAGRDENKEGKPKKTKSSTNLSSLLSRPKSSKNLKDDAAACQPRTSKDKENRTPPASTSAGVDSRPPPIYAQFSSQAFAVQPLGGKFLEDEIDRYTPREYSPDKQHDFRQEHRAEASVKSQRPKSTYLPSSLSIQDIHMRKSGESMRRSMDVSPRPSADARPSFERKTTEPTTKSEMTMAKRGARVMAAVTALGNRQKVVEPERDLEPALKDEDVDKEFEAMLDRRNIPEHQRGKMRSLALSMKKDFVKQDWAEIAAAKNVRPGTNGSDSSADATAETEDVHATKAKRPRSRTFTISRKSSKDTESTTKKARPDSFVGKHTRTKSNESTTSNKTLTGAGVAVASTLIAKAKGQLPEDFVSYLKKVQKPELIEVGRLHKLRLLLRNETVAWTDDFIRQGGMEEIVGLLHRTLEVEWREEHEDLLLHEVLLCLKALSTTALALQHLNRIQSTLFPAMIHMLFDEEKKGPSEFTTRNIVTSLLFTYLKSAPLAERSERAKILLAYLRDPEPKEEERPVPFVLEMHQPRPYRVWCKEVVNVTKEVFWIFLHNHNVVAQPSSNTGHATHLESAATNDTQYQYMIDHFPQELPPVPAAPYVGGVEWDATNYLASHLEILNSILVSLPSYQERNKLREELRVSGWEKCMGATLRLCKEKFYGGVHAGLRCWVAAAKEDGWDTRDVRCGPVAESRSPVKKAASSSPAKNKLEEPPKLALEFKFEEKKTEVDTWL
ncbi:GTPase binding protein Rid1 [Coleophoma crateriformis]|uniref:GTPase binding protein Rid1 n=1 Tax=Coleophoma crateriformis TaxID=565419 RepID=A0A3D8T7P5_9HELO|nr:GTPase binding protein Rid1 [Coleophoma crateriformis]